MTTNPALTADEVARIPTRPPSAAGADNDNGTTSSLWEGRLFGALVLSAFVLYGVGSAFTDDAGGITLIVLNSVAVAVIGVLGFRLVRASDRRIGAGYLAGRIAESILLAAGVILAAGSETSTADETSYLLAMAALGIGSVPFWNLLGRSGVLPTWLARWGVLGYVGLFVGALIELMTDSPVLIYFAVVGGLFELFIGIRLVSRGFGQSR